MALAIEQLTRIDDLDDLLRYLTEDLSYRKGVAVYLMDQHYLDGQLLLEKQDYIHDGEPYGGWDPIDAKYGHLEFDRHGRMRVVPRIKPWREARYRIAEQCDARAIWPLHPTAPQPAPDQQPEDKSGPDPSEKPKETLGTKPKENLETRLIDLMKELQLKSGMFPREVRATIKQPFKDKFKDKYDDQPAHSTITRAYKKYTSAKQSAE
jgi:hypothetical protein